MQQAYLGRLLALAVALVACGQETTMPSAMSLTSQAFVNGGAIPARYTCSGADVSPPLSWNGVPGGTHSLALTVIDPDAPGRPFVHWVVFNLPAAASDLGESAQPAEGTIEGRNDFGSTGYRGPCPPPGSPHHYHFRLYALDNELSLKSGASESSFQDAIKGHVLASGELVGTFKR